MQLTEDQLENYGRDGFLVLPGVLTDHELGAIRSAFAEDAAADGPHRITEDDGTTIRAIYASHTRHPLFRDLVSSERLLGPATQLVSQGLYVYQFKINAKQPFGGEAWAWHQDYPVWRDFDRMPAPQAVNVAVFVDEVTEFNGPVVFLRGSHRLGSADRVHRGDSRSEMHVDPHDYAVPADELAGLAETHEMTSPKGPAGTVVFFHPEIVHGSAPNISPFPRNLLIATYNASENAPRPAVEPRPEYLVGRDTTPLVPHSRELHPALALEARS